MLITFVLSSPQVAAADLITFTNQTEYVLTLSSLGYQSMHEGFENDAVWGSVRSTIAGGFQTAPSVTSLGVTWSSNSANSGVTTGSGAARTGDWGFYSYPHGDPPNVGDGFVGESVQVLYGVGGWIRTNTPPAGISLWLDKESAMEREVDFGDAAGFSGSVFFGVIDTAGFTRFDYLETEFDTDEQKYLFADDFRYAVAVPEANPFWLLAVVAGMIAARRRWFATGPVRN